MYLFCFLWIFIPWYGAGQKLVSFKKSECQDQCCAPNTIIEQKLTEGNYTLTFGLFETCNDHDTLLFELSNDTLNIVFGEKNKLSSRTVNGRQKACFLSSDEEECDCYYLYKLEFREMKMKPKALVVGKKMFVPKRGFVPIKYAKDFSNKNDRDVIPLSSRRVIDTLPAQSLSKIAVKVEQAVWLLTSDLVVKADIQLFLSANKSENELSKSQFEQIQKMVQRRTKYNICGSRLNFKIAANSQNKEDNTSSVIVIDYTDTGSPLFSSP